MEQVTEKEISIVNMAYDTHLLRDISMATGLKTKDIWPINFDNVKNEKTQMLINGCRELLEEDLETLKELLGKE